MTTPAPDPIALVGSARPTKPSARIFYPQLESEFEVQAYIHRNLTALGVEVRGEVCSSDMSCIFDLVVFVRDEAGKFRPVRIIETKKRRKCGRKSVRYARKEQMARYSAFGLPIDVIHGIHAAKRYIEAVRAKRSIIRGSDPISF